jgi:hypothetical protein
MNDLVIPEWYTTITFILLIFFYMGLSVQNLIELGSRCLELHKWYVLSGIVFSTLLNIFFIIIARWSSINGQESGLRFNFIASIVTFVIFAGAVFLMKISC